MGPRIYDKTDKGREEIATRKYQVAPKLRTLLVMIDGRQALESLLRDFALLGLSEDHVDALLRQDLIRLVSGGAASAVPAPALGAAHPALALTATAPAPPVAHAPPATAQDNIARFRAVYDFYNQTIKSTIGLRGIGLQLKVEKAATIDDLRALRLPYLKAVLKARGRATALGLRDRLDALCGGTPEPDDFALPDDNSTAQRRAASALMSILPTTP